VNVIKIECIGDGTPRRRDFGVWELTGLSSTRGPFIKQPVPAQKDYAESNGIGSRGVYAYYLCKDGPVYEVKKPISWSRTDQYYVQFYQGNKFRLEISEVFKCLANTPSVKVS